MCLPVEFVTSVVIVQLKRSRLCPNNSKKTGLSLCRAHCRIHGILKISITPDIILCCFTSVGTVHLLTVKHVVNVCRFRAFDHSSLGHCPVLSTGGFRYNSALKF